MENKEEKNFRPASFSWYPGHMAKTKKDLIESLKLIDIVIEILDARIPKSSKNPELEQYTKTKKKIIVLNKSDLADENVTKRWVEYYQSKDIVAIPVEANTGKGMKNIIAEIKKEAKEIIDKQNDYRVLVLVHTKTLDKEIINPIIDGYILIEDEIRREAKDTLNYFIH